MIPELKSIIREAYSSSTVGSRLPHPHSDLRLPRAQAVTFRKLGENVRAEHPRRIRYPMTTNATSPTKRQNLDFDALRLFFASLVLFSHSFELIRRPDPIQAMSSAASLGQLAVDGFFLISGFLITQSWMSDPSIKRFLAKRMLRMYPAFIVAVIFSAFVAGPLGAMPHQYFAEFDYLHFLRSMLALQGANTPKVFAGTSIELVNGSMWTISFEVRCYILAMVIGLAGLFARRYAVLLLTVALGIWISVSTPLDGSMNVQHLPFGIKALRVSDTMLWFVALFMTGSSYALFRDRIRFNGFTLLLAFVALCVCLVHPSAQRFGVLLAGAYFVFCLASMGRSKHGAKQAQGTDISYGLYLYGWPIQKLLAWYVPSLSPWGIFALTLVIAGALAFASWHFVEKPALKIKPRPKHRPANPSTSIESAEKLV